MKSTFSTCGALLLAGATAFGQIVYSGLPVTQVGDPTTEPRGDGSLRLSGFSGSGLKGIRLDAGPVPGLRVDFDSAISHFGLPGDAEFAVDALGEGGAVIASISLSRWTGAGSFEVIPVFAGVGADKFNIRFFNGTTLVHESLGRTAPPRDEVPASRQVFMESLPRAIRAVAKPGEGLVFEFHLGSPVVFAVHDALISEVADRIEIRAANASMTPTFISGLMLAFGGISERIISGVAIEMFGQEIRGSQHATLASDANGITATRTQPEPPALPTPPTSGNPFPYPWDLNNPVGRFGLWHTINPSRFSGAEAGGPALVHIDLTDVPTATLLKSGLRAGKSAARLEVEFPALNDGGKLWFVAGGVLENFPGQAAIALGRLNFSRQGNRTFLSAEPSASSARHASGSETALDPADYRVDIRLANGQSRTYTGLPETLRVSWETAGIVGYYNLPVVINADGTLSLSLERSPGNPLPIVCPANDTVEAVEIKWTLRLNDAIAPGSLRALEITEGSEAAVVGYINLASLTTSTANPTPPSYFLSNPVRALGNATFRHDAFASLAINGLSQSGQDGIAITYSSGQPIRLDLQDSLPPHNMFLGYPPQNSILDLRLVDPANPAPPFAVLHGETRCSQVFAFRPEFPGLAAAKYTIRAYLGGNLVQTLVDVPVTPNAQCGMADLLIHHPHIFTFETIDNQFAIVLRWNRSRPVQGLIQNDADRIELLADAPPNQPYPSVLEFRAGGMGYWRLPGFVNRTDPVAPKLNFQMSGGRLLLNWGQAASGTPKLQVAPDLTGPWVNLGLGKLLGDGRRSAEIPMSGEKGYVRPLPPKENEGCLDFSTEPPDQRDNPFKFNGWEFDRYPTTGGGPRSPHNEIVQLDDYRWLRFDGRMEIILPAAGAEVDLMFRQSGGPVDFIAYDDAGEADRKTTSALATVGESETVTLRQSGDRPLRRVAILSGTPVVHLLSTCLRATPTIPPAEAQACLSWGGAEMGAVLNPWVHGDLSLTSRNGEGALDATQISMHPGLLLVGYEVEHTAVLHFAAPCPWVKIDFHSGSGHITFQPYDDLGNALTAVEMFRVTDPRGEALVFSGSPRPIARIVVTSENGLTRLLKVCCGPVPRWHDRDVLELTAPPLRNLQPMADILWSFTDTANQPVTPAFATVLGETGLKLEPDTHLEFTGDQQSVELRIVVGADGATFLAEHSGRGFAGPIPLPRTQYEEGPNVLRFLDNTYPADGGATIAHVRLRLQSGTAIVTRVSTPFMEE